MAEPTAKNIGEFKVYSVEGMTVLELRMTVLELLRELDEKLGVRVASSTTLVGGDAPPESASEFSGRQFDVVLHSAGDNRIEVIKMVRSVTGLGPKEAKRLVSEAPKPLLERVSSANAEMAKAQLDGVGAEVLIVTSAAGEDVDSPGNRLAGDGPENVSIVPTLLACAFPWAGTAELSAASQIVGEHLDGVQSRRSAPLMELREIGSRVAVAVGLPLFDPVYTSEK